LFGQPGKLLVLAAVERPGSHLRLLVESAHDYAIFSIGLDGAIKTWSAGAQRIFGYSQPEVVGRNFAMLFSPADAPFAAEELRSASIAETVNVERWLVRKNGSTFLASGKTTKLLAGDAAGKSRGFVKIVHDTTEEYAAAEEMRRQARYDTLTELPNRQTFYEHVQRAISIFKRRSSSCFAVLFIDLDHFKAISDDRGHIVADHVLNTIARRLEGCARSGDVVARVGGDEFAILLNGISGPLDADDAAQRILTVMQEAVKTDAGDVFAAVSVGIASGTVKHERPEDIMRDADAAMYVAKTQGRARAVVFDESIANVVRDNAALISALRHAVERNELRIAYQPVLRLRDMAVVGFEALVRWKHPRRGLLLPSEFIPFAEESNLVVAIDRWVLAQACWQLGNWQGRGAAESMLQMSVNVSSKEFSRDDFLADRRDIIDASEVAATCLRLEITEHTLLERSPRAYATLASVRALGAHIDVDDFGTGYASLGALNDIFVDGLKIDWSFVTSKHSQHGWEIVESVISLAHKLGLVAIAEGIETTQQLDRLVSLGCDFGQGHLFAPALGAVAAGAFLRDRSQS
jgi:diguanylate cyclase (GGDEF)-like protein/PAS domain S-box-containing protein